MSESEPVVLDGASLTPEDVAAVARDGRPVAISDSAREAVRESRERVEEVLDGDEAVYGLNTGFGQLVTERIPARDRERLQTNLVRSHASGVGRELEREEVRAMMLTRINALVKGYSGIREVVVDHLVTMLNREVHPVVKSRGSLGASGDLAPLAHQALVLLGEGEARVSPRDTERSSGRSPRDEDGERLDGEAALAKAGLEPLSLAAKEGLALINGTQLSVGLGALCVVDAERALRGADIAGALTTEVLMGTTAACDPAIQDVRPHSGQATSARNVRNLTAGSEIVESHRNCDRVQDAYSIRCLPQVHGAARDAVSHLREAVEIELNSATDNPLIFAGDSVDDRASGTENVGVLSGGNFHGAPLALRLDYATNALADLAAIAERRVDRLLNPNLQEDHLPPFLTPDSGVCSGYMIAQYSAAALVNENRSLGAPSIDNTPVSGGQEDHVSMSAQSALNARTAVENALTVVGIELLCGAQAMEFVDDGLAPGSGTGVAYDTIRDVIPPLDDDRPLHAEIEIAAELIATGTLEARVERGANEPIV
ncbi:histidine ammonia-lyase [Halalkalicoccus sp. NIPERK01]|uniref:histidine ammonia-lyase n=1 Tax=Halalkalicoccus sp. NIPERK01 TaxID=3053469 RepID=UPI00256EF426|nr:histidine ammonia-lyase [Halalkalicoccus sp. NIPERK01]MDL5363134.1 histidine ammonia-lyase [Halalkalicoccus sp. NIPERK01]